MNQHSVDEEPPINNVLIDCNRSSTVSNLVLFLGAPRNYNPVDKLYDFISIKCTYCVATEIKKHKTDGGSWLGESSQPDRYSSLSLLKWSIRL